MRWFERYAHFHKPDRLIGSKNNPYMHRWHLIPYNFWFNIYLHRFLRSDEDRALHDHPSWNISCILQGEYTEETIAAGGVHYSTIMKAGSWKFRFARAAHRIHLHAGPCWTLFIMGPKLRTWGFHCINGWRSRREFDEKGCD
jgi:hypothetical protein